MSEEIRPGWGMALDPLTFRGDCRKGACEFSRSTPLFTFDCMKPQMSKEWDPMWFPGKKFLSLGACRYQGEIPMRNCPHFQEAKT